jgi:hypothetical protein
MRNEAACFTQTTIQTESPMAAKDPLTNSMENIVPIQGGISLSRFRKIWFVFIALVLLSIPAFLEVHTIQAAVSLPVAASGNLYFLPQYAGLLYFKAPFAVISTLVLFLSPGLLAALALGKAKSVGQWVVYGFTVSLILVSVSAAILQGLIKAPLRGMNFGFLAAACALLCFGFLYLRTLRGLEVQLPAHIGSTFVISFLAIWLLVAGLAPKFYWENFNGDGAHAYEAARLLLFQPFPFWDSSAGNAASFPGITSMLFTYPVAWFIRFWGEFEASSRIPYLLFLVCTFGALQMLIEQDQKRRMRLVEQALIWLSLIVYTIAIAYSATYNPYSADLSLPATQDTLTMVCYLGFIFAFLVNDTAWMVLFLLLTFFSLPNGLLLIGMWMAGVVLVFRPIPWRRLVIIAGGIVFFFVLSFAMPRLMSFFNLPYSGDEYGLVNLLSRFAFLQFTDFQRFLFMIVPAGILPALSLVLWKLQDPAAKALTLLTLIYFGFFYFQAYTALHYFIPVMLIPLVVFWRVAIRFRPGRLQWIYAASAVTGIAAFILSLPATFTIDTSAQTIGATIENRIPGYATHDPAVYRGAALFTDLFPYDWDPAVPDRSYGGSTLVWNFYTFHKKDPHPLVNYVLQDINDQPPDGMRLFASNAEFALYIRDANVLANQRALRPNTPAGSPLYTIPRSFLFHSISSSGGPAIINVLDVLKNAGFNMTPILQKLGIENTK